MVVYTKTANDVFAPNDAGGAPRGVENGDAQRWGTEVERAISEGAGDVDAKIAAEAAARQQADADLSDRIDGAVAGLVQAATWATLASINGTRSGQPGRVTGPDAGSHTDPVVGGSVANIGEYAWSVSPAGWQRVGDIEKLEEATNQQAEQLTATGVYMSPAGVAIPLANVRRQTNNYLAGVSGTGAAYTAQATPALSSLTTRLTGCFIPHVDSEAVPTLNIGGVGAAEMRDQSNRPLPAGALRAGTIYHFIYLAPFFRVTISDQDNAMNQTDFDASAIVGTTPQTLIDADATRTSLMIANPNADGMIGVNLFGGAPVINAAGSLTLGPGAALELSRPPKGVVNVVADREGAAVTAFFGNASGIDPRAARIVGDIIGAFSTGVTPGTEAAMLKFVSSLLAQGIFNKLSHLYVPAAAPTLADCAVDWVSKVAGTVHGTLTHHIYQDVQGDGSTGYIDTGFSLANDPYFKASNASLFAHMPDNVANGNAYLIGYGGGGLSPNRTGGNFTARLNGAALTLNSAGNGGFFAASRLNGEQTTLYRNNTIKQTFADTPVNPGVVAAFNLVVMANNGSSGATTFTAREVGLAGCGAGLTESEYLALYTANADLMSALLGEL